MSIRTVLSARSERRAREASERERAAALAKEEEVRRAARERLASAIGVAGFLIALVGVPLVATQNFLLEQQIRVEGPVLSATTQVIDDTRVTEMFTPGGSLEYVFPPGDADAIGSIQPTTIRVEVLNGGRAVGAVTGAALKTINGDIPLSVPACGFEEDVPSISSAALIPCEMPVRVEPGTIEVMTFALPTYAVDCSARPQSDPSELVLSLQTSTDDDVISRTGVRHSLDTCRTTEQLTE